VRARPAAHGGGPGAEGAAASGPENLLTTTACTLPTSERPVRLAEFDDLFATALRRVERGGPEVRMHLSGPTGLRDRVRDLTDRESSCCSFFAFALTGTDGDVVLSISVPPARREILEALARRAEELAG